MNALITSSRRRRWLLSATAFAAAMTAGSALAQPWPNRSVAIVVPFAPGGTTDVLDRTVGIELAKSLGQPVIVENKPGAGATVGAEQLSRATPDGHTLLMGAVHHTIATSVYKKPNCDFQKSFAPVTTVALVPNVLVVNPAVPAQNVKELLALAKADPGRYSFGSNGIGTG